MDTGNRTIEDRAINITEQLVCSPPDDDDWQFVSMSNLGGESRIEAVALGAEPHFISVSVRREHGTVRIGRVSCCEHLEVLAERILGLDAVKGHER